MQSLRLNKKGEEIPSLKDPWDLYKHSGVSNNGIIHNPHFPRHPYASAWGDNDVGGMTDEDWSEYNRQRRDRGQTTLATTTSLGTGRAKKTQDDLNQFLVQNNRWAIGDYVTFACYGPDNPMVTLHTITFVLACERLIEKVKWDYWDSAPKPFLLLSLSPLTRSTPNQSNPFMMNARWDNLLYKRHLSMNEMNGIIKTNVQLQDYIEQAKESFKAGKLTIEG